MDDLRQTARKIWGVPAGFRLIKRLYNGARSSTSPFAQRFPAGHFYSPLPDEAWVRAHQDTLFRETDAVCPGIDLRDSRQLEVLGEMAEFYGEFPFADEPTSPFRYYLDNSFYTYGDAIVLYGMLRRLKPKRIIEVGSGFSSAAMLDTDEHFLGASVDFTFIEPYPERLLGLLSEKDQHRCKLLQKPLQEVAPSTFDALQEGDLLFIDSSHVAKIGSDVHHAITNVLPLLNKGVIIHFHDIFWPFEYPKEWILGGRAWNEAYFLHAFLLYNASFEIEYFNSYMALRHGDALRSTMPLCLQNPGGGLWLKKTT